MSGEVETKIVSSMTVGVDAPSASGSLADSLVGIVDRLGRYVLLERLGRGAFGTVWAAFDPQLDRKVAIKIVHGHKRPGTEADKVREDLLSEAQLLAQLSHPHVVAIHDVGRLEDAMGSMSAMLLGGEGDSLSISDTAGAGPASVVGVFIVMEHLDGPTLAEWIEAEPRPSSAEILRVFGEAGRGLQAAHARGFVHLDFKPSNVMFGEEGRIRVLDFGLARVGRQLRRSSAPGRTRVAGTPPYMAPEQHTGEEADERADQYAFCVSLWEALHGARPFTGEDMEGVFAAKYAGPPKLQGIPASLNHVQAALERGLAFDRDERFASMQELLEILADDPRRRRRRWIAGAGLVAGLLGAGFGLARASEVKTGDPCALPEDQFVGVWDEQRREAVAAAFARTGVEFADETFAEVATDLDGAIMRWSKVRREVCRATLVEAEVAVEQMSQELLCLDRRLRRVAGLTATLAEADAEIVARARDSVSALDEPETCRSDPRDPRRAFVGADRRLALLSVEDGLTRARVFARLGRYEEALEGADQAIERATTLDDGLGLARGQRQRAIILRELGRVDEALSQAMTALAGAARVEARELETELLIDLVLTHSTAGDFARALAIRELLEARVDSGEAPKLAMRAHLHAAVMHERQQHWDEALRELDAAAALVEGELAGDAALSGQIHLSYGNVLVNSDRDFERGAREYRLGIELLTEAFGPHHPQLAKTRMNLGAVYFRRSDYAGAIALLESALADFESIYPDAHPFIGMSHQNLGAVYFVAGEFREAIEHTRESLALTEATLGTEHPSYATAERNLATLLMLVGQHRESQGHFDHARAVYEASYDAEDTRLMAVHAELAEVAWWLGDDALAREHADIAKAKLALAEAVDHRRVGPLSTLALLADHAGELELARTHASELVEFAESLLGPDNRDLARSRIQLAGILRQLGEREAAATQLELALAKLGLSSGALHPFAWAGELELGHLARDAGERDAAIEHYEAALALAEGPEGAEVHAAIVELALAALDADDARAARARAVLEAHGVRADLG